MRCLRCEGNTIVETESGAVCESCGLVLEEGALHREVEFRTVNGVHERQGALVNQKSQFFGSHQGLLAPVNIQIRKSKLTAALHRLCDLLKLPSKYTQSAEFLLSRITREEFYAPRGVEFTAAVALCIALRQESAPLTLIDVAVASGINLYTLGREYMRTASECGIVLEAVDPSALVHRACTQFGLTNDREMQLATKANIIIHMAKDDWLVTGRKPSGIAAAAIYLAAQSDAVISVSVTFNALATILNVGIRTIKDRYRELTDLFWRMAQTLPWKQEITKRSLPRHLNFFFQRNHMELIRACTAELLNETPYSFSVRGKVEPEPDGTEETVLSSNLTPLPTTTSISAFSSSTFAFAGSVAIKQQEHVGHVPPLKAYVVSARTLKRSHSEAVKTDSTGLGDLSPFLPQRGPSTIPEKVSLRNPPSYDSNHKNYMYRLRVISAAKERITLGSEASVAAKSCTADDDLAERLLRIGVSVEELEQFPSWVHLAEKYFDADAQPRKIAAVGDDDLLTAAEIKRYLF